MAYEVKQYKLMDQHWVCDFIKCGRVIQTIHYGINEQLMELDSIRWKNGYDLLPGGWD